MLTLGIDPATKTGWAIYDGSRVVESGVQDFSKRRGETNGLLFLRFRKWISELVQYPGIGLIGYERPHLRGGYATELLMGLQTRIQEAAAEHGIEAAPVHTGTIKKWATGHGNASKEEMMARAAAYLGRAPIDDNESDAVLLAAYVSEEYGV